MSQFWAPGPAWDRSLGDWSHMYRHEDHLQPGIDPSSSQQMPPRPRGFPTRTSRPITLEQLQPWRDSPWSFSGAGPSPGRGSRTGIWDSDGSWPPERSEPVFGGPNQEPPSAASTTSSCSPPMRPPLPPLPTPTASQAFSRKVAADRSPGSPFYRRLKELLPTTPVSRTTLPSPGSNTRSDYNSSPPKDTVSFHAKRKALQTRHANASRRSDKSEYSESEMQPSIYQRRPQGSPSASSSPFIDLESTSTSSIGESSQPTSTDTSPSSLGSGMPGSFPSSATLTCVACAEELPVEDFPKSPLTGSCDHPNSACSDCIKQWISTRLDDGTWDQIKCLECNNMMQYEDVQRHADQEVFQRYDTLAARSWFNNEEDFVWCRTKGCGSGQVHVGGESEPLFQCVACKAQFCLVHQVPWHEGETCTAFETRMNGGEPIEEGAPMDSASASYYGIRAPSPSSSDSSYNFVRANNRQERRLYDQAQERRNKTDAQIAQDFAAALALEYADDDQWYYGRSDPWKEQPKVTRSDPWAQHPDAIFHDPWTAPSSSGYMPTSSREWAPCVSASRSMRSPPPPPPPPPPQEPISIRVAAERMLDRAGSRLPHQLPIGRSDFVFNNHDPHNNLQGSSYCATFARNLQKRFEREDHDRRAKAEHEARRQRSAREDNERAAKQQAQSDAKAARNLQRQFEREERDRVQQRQKEQERQAYQRRKQEEQQGEQTVKANAKQCPKCRWYIQKKDGCDHMTCTKCRYEFCWLCLADYQSIRNRGNSAHNSSCRDYRRG